MARSRISRLVLAAALAGVAMSFGAGGVLGDGSVQILTDRFDPATVTIGPGDKVTWRNDLSSGAHTATADDSAFDTGPVGPGQQAIITFVMAGSFGYTCQIDPSMKGTVEVADEPLSTPTPTPRKPPPTDLVSDLTDGSSGGPIMPILGLLLSIAGLTVIGTQRILVRRAAVRRWKVVGPGEAARRGSGHEAEYAHADLWTTDDRPRG